MNRKLLYHIILALILTTPLCLLAQPEAATGKSRDQRMEWWRQARFGMFIHWGLYSIPAGEWKGETDHAEWIRTTAHIPLKVYDSLAMKFNPLKFNAEEWVKTAKNAGMKYIVLTSKHHDGFCLFDSKYSDFDVMSTPFGRDILKELSDACRKYDMKICWYHSIMDWHHPDYLPRRDWETDRTAEGADFDRYFEYLKHQVNEILTNYGDISVIWFDGEWENTWSHEYAKKLYTYIREFDPDIIINNRIDVYRDGMAGLSTNTEALGDFGTPEQEIPENGIPGKDWESCMTMNDHWGYNKADHNWKSSRELIYNLVDIASKGGNYLLNVGPTAEGVFPPESMERLKAIGSWMSVNGSSIYGTQASPFKNAKWGKCTIKSTSSGTRLFLHVFNPPAGGKLSISNFVSEPVKAFLLKDPGETALNFQKKAAGVDISLPEKAYDSLDLVVVLDIKGEPKVLDQPGFEFRYDATSDKVECKLNSLYNDPKVTLYYTLDGETPSDKSTVYSKPVLTKLPVELKALIFYNGRRTGEMVEYSLPLSFGKNVTLENPPSDKYKASGASSLTDGQLGSLKFGDGKWMGFEGQDFKAIVDLGKKTAVHSAELGYLVNTNSWIFEPVEILVQYSTDGQNYKPLLDKKFTSSLWKQADAVKRYSDVFPEVNARFIMIVAKNRGTCPAGHPGAGGKSWLFLDEIGIR